jgi:hypothetical protein
MPFLHFSLLLLGVASLTRLGLTLYTGSDTVPTELWFGIFVRGLAFDLTVLAWVLAPGFLWAALTPARLRSTRWRHPLRLGLFFFAACLMLFVGVAEATFWEEFSTRFNFIAVDYLIYTTEVIGNLR